MAREGGGQGGGLHHDHGHCPGDVPEMPEGASDPEDSPGQVRGEGCVHEQRDAAGDQGEDEL